MSAEPDIPPHAKPSPAPHGEPLGIAMRFANEWILPRWRAVVLSFFVAIGLGAATSGYPAVIKYAFDTLGTGKFDHLRMVLFGIIAITAARGLFLYLHQIVSNTIVMSLTADLQQRTFRHLINADFAQITHGGTGQQMSRLTNDIAYIQASTQQVLNTLLRDLVTVVGLVAFMFYTDWAMAMIIVLIYPFAILPITLISRRLRKTAKKTQHELGDMTSLLNEKLSSARLVKTYRLEDYAAGKLDERFRQVLSLRLKAVRQRARLGPILEALAGVAIAGVIGLASWRVSTGIASTGDFMAFVTALLLAANNLRSLGALATSTQEGIAGIERLYQVLDTPPKVVDRPNAKPLRVRTGEIALQNVTFAYDAKGEYNALRDLTLNILGGKTTAFVGRSGAGKSTLLNLVPRLFDVNGGAILIDGQDVRDVTVASLRDQIAIVSQDVTLFDDTIRANIGLGRLGATFDDIVSAAKAAAAHDFIMAQPLGYDTIIGESGNRLSGGQRQRLALARAILRNAPILLLDEATSALDTESEQLVQDALARFSKNRTTLVIAHRLSTVQNADIICVLDGGEIVEIGPHAELFARNGAYARLCRSQLLIQAEAPSQSLN